MTSPKHWTILNSKMVLDHQWCRVRQDTVALPNGSIIDDFFVNVRPDIAVVFPVTPQQEVVFVRQYRHAVEQVLLELPAGSFNPDVEEAQEAATRELQEETGYIADQLILLATLYDNPVKDTNKIHLFLALDVSQQETQQLDITEDIEVVLVPVSDLEAKIMGNEICVSGSIAAISLGLKFLNGHQR